MAALQNISSTHLYISSRYILYFLHNLSLIFWIPRLTYVCADECWMWKTESQLSAAAHSLLFGLRTDEEAGQARSNGDKRDKMCFWLTMNARNHCVNQHYGLYPHMGSMHSSSRERMTYKIPGGNTCICYDEAVFSVWRPPGPKHPINLCRIKDRQASAKLSDFHELLFARSRMQMKSIIYLFYLT